MSLLSFNDVSISFGHQPLLEKVNFSLEKGDHVGLIGRNGEGKSTLLKLITQELKPDAGEVKLSSVLNVQYLMQSVPEDETGLVFDVVASGLGSLGAVIIEHHALSNNLNPDPQLEKKLLALQERLEHFNAWDLVSKINALLSKMNLDPDKSFRKLSGGVRRRVLLARSLLSEPDILLLDEPTNHLDLESIQWLEDFLKSYKGTFVLVSHDRTFLDAITNRIFDLDRGMIRSFSCGYESYKIKKEELLKVEERENREFDKKLAKEEVWIRQGIKARRTRNEGRVRKLKALREERRLRREKQSLMTLDKASLLQSGKLVFEAKELCFSQGEQTIINNFSTLVGRGDKIGLVGPNGCGKTTLLKLLLGELALDSGELVTGTKLNVAYFDQMRVGFDEEKSAVDNLGQGSQTVNVFGEEKHVIGYLQQFLFTPDRARSPVKYYSGGEKNRLYLASLFIKNANLIILDEPTNDLDIEALEVLEAFLVDYPGTLLVVSHDRSFLNNIVTSSWVYQGQGEFKEYVGSYCDYSAADKKDSLPTLNPPSVKKKNSFGREEQKLLNRVTKKIEKLEGEIEIQQEALANPDLYLDENREQYKEMTSNLKTLEKSLAESYEQWERLEQLKINDD